jgi:uncharacterized membrane protein YraQ (UPF0718 family)
MIKTILLRYRVFVVLMIISIGISITLPEIGFDAMNITKQNLLEMMSVIPPIFVLLGLLDVWVDRATMIKYTGKGSGLRGVLIAFLIGSAAAGPLYAAFPVAGMMIKKGSSLFNIFVFIGAWSTTKIPMLTFEAANMGLSFTLLRLSLSIVGILLIAIISDKLLTHEDKAEIYKLNQS